MPRTSWIPTVALAAACSSQPAGNAARPDAPGHGSNQLDASAGGDGGGIAAARCTAPTWTASDQFHAFAPTADSSTAAASGWGVFDNQWSCGNAACLDETVSACTAGSWYATSSLAAGNTAVLTYVSTQVNFPQVPLASFTAIASTFSEVSPHDATGSSSEFGDYEAAYDVFFGPTNNNEIMVWVDNNGQTPINGGHAQATGVTIGGTEFDVYFGGTTTSWVARDNFSSGDVDLLSIFQYTTGTLNNFDGSADTGALTQVQFGWELCSTNGSAETFYLDELSLVAE